VIVYIHNSVRLIDQRLSYTLDFISEHPLTPAAVHFTLDSNKSADKTINYGSESDTLSIPAQNLFFQEQYNSDPHYMNAYESGSKHLYSVENLEKKSSSFVENGVFGFDIFEAIFFHISRYEMYNINKELLNDRGMLKEDQMLLVKNGLEKIPIVDQLVESFLVANGISPNQFSTRYVITHDIDHIRKYDGNLSIIKKSLGHIKRNRISEIPSTLQQYKESKANAKDPYDVFAEMLLDVEDIEKHIFYLVGGTTKFDTPIPFDDPIFRESIRLAKERNYTIGIHPSYDCWKSEEQFSKQHHKLESEIGMKINMSRQHYLHFSFPETLEILENQKIEIDSSMGFTQRIGFSCGTGFIYKMYNLSQEKSSSVHQLPLVVMDSSLLKEAKEDSSNFSTLLVEFLQENSNNNQITFNFHNSRFDDMLLYDIDLWKMYRSLINRKNN